MSDEVAAALEEIAELQNRALGYIRANGFIWEGPGSIGIEPGNWQHLAFSLYSDICLASSMANYVREHMKQQPPVVEVVHIETGTVFKGRVDKEEE